MNQDSAVGDKVEWTVVVDFADEVKGLASGVGRDADRGDWGGGIVDGELRRSNLLLLPPTEGEGVAIGVGRGGGVQTEDIACLGGELQGREAVSLGSGGGGAYDDLRIAVATSFVGPLHAGGEVVEFIGVETLLVAYADAAKGLLPTGPRRGERVGTEPTLMVACPACLRRVFGIVQAIGHDVEETRRVALNTLEP